MSYNVELAEFCKKQVKRLVKKHPSLKVEINTLIVSLETDPKQGTSIGSGCYKIRLAIKSEGKGKSGGARVITYFYIEKTTVVLLSIHDKSEQESISDKEIKLLLSQIK